MKRRMKLWIACAALGVVALSAFALFYRPLPFRFLQGAEFQGLAIQSTSLVGRSFFGSPLPPPQDETVRTYRIVKVWGRVVEQAELELTPEKGWTRGPERGPALFRNGDETVLIEIDPQSYRNVPDIVWVRLARPTTPHDRILEWLYNR